MHYALCKICSFLPRPVFVPHETSCIMRFMHCDRMHYDKVDCTVILSFSPDSVKLLPNVTAPISLTVNPLLNVLSASTFPVVSTK